MFAKSLVKCEIPFVLKKNKIIITIRDTSCTRAGTYRLRKNVFMEISEAEEFTVSGNAFIFEL